MANEFNLNLNEIDPELAELLLTYSPGQPGKITLDFETMEVSEDGEFKATISGASDLTTPTGERASADESEGSSEQIPPALLVIGAPNGSEARETT